MALTTATIIVQLVVADDCSGVGVVVALIRQKSPVKDDVQMHVSVGSGVQKPVFNSSHSLQFRKAIVNVSENSYNK